MSEGKIGLSAVLGESSSEKPVSAVSSIASQFNDASLSSTSSADLDGDKKVSEKVSTLATRFGKTIDEAPTAINLAGNHVRRIPSKPRAKPAIMNAAATETNGKVTEVAKRFASPSTAPSQASLAAGGNDGAGFASAHDMFRRAEEAERRPPESKVSSFAKRIEVGATASFDSTDGSDTRVATVTRSFKSRGKDTTPLVSLPHAAMAATISCI